MIARAPGKVVVSGAYAVLEGAPAVVAAVDRYVVADARRQATLVPAEVAQALRMRGPACRAPWFDARELRDETGQRKLGLGSSAAILVASLAALELAAEPSLDGAALAERTFAPALAAHRAAQGGGSGVDVAASAFGGILRFQRRTADAALPSVEPFALPKGLFIEIASSREAASTADMIQRVAELATVRPSDHRRLMGRLAAAAESAVEARVAGAFLSACSAQRDVLDELGTLARAPIVTDANRHLHHALSSRGALALPSGAGGGDIVLLLSTTPLDDDARRAIEEFGFSLMSVSLGAPGVHRAGSPVRQAEHEVIA
jgi:phosphomevalonate kinase